MSFIFPSPEPQYDSLESYELVEAKQQLRDLARSVQDSIRQGIQSERQDSEQRNRVVTCRFPKEQLARLDEVVADAATSRGHLIRQIVASYLSYIDDCHISYKGSMI